MLVLHNPEYIFLVWGTIQKKTLWNCVAIFVRIPQKLMLVYGKSYALSAWMDTNFDDNTH